MGLSSLWCLWTEARACDVYGAEIQQITPTVWMVQGAAALGSRENHNFIANSAVVLTSAGPVVIDALGSPRLAQRWIECIHSLSPWPVRRVLVTHYHADHVYGLQAFQALGAEVLAQDAGKAYLQSDQARQRLQASRQALAPWVDQDTRLVPADLWLNGDIAFELGGVRFELIHVGPAHTPEDMAIYLPQQGVLFTGDLVFRDRLPYVGEADSSRWITSLERLLALKPKVLVPGHGPWSGSPEADIRLTRDYLAYLRDQLKPAAHDLQPFDEAYAQIDWSRFAKVPMFGVANRMNAYNVYLQLQDER